MSAEYAFGGYATQKRKCSGPVADPISSLPNPRGQSGASGRNNKHATIMFFVVSSFLFPPFLGKHEILGGGIDTRAQGRTSLGEKRRDLRGVLPTYASHAAHKSYMEASSEEK